MTRTAPNAGLLLRLARNLRLRLTLSYILFFAIVLVSLGFLVREVLSVVLNQQNERLLDEEWTSLKGYLRVVRGELVWAFDPEDPDEAFAVERLHRLLMLADADGNVVELSAGYSALGQESKDTIQRVLSTGRQQSVLRYNVKGEAFLVRLGVLHDDGRQLFCAIGLPVEQTQVLPGRIVRTYFLALPVILLAIVILGWFAAGSALRPLRQVTGAIRTVADGNLSLRLPPMESGDELDTLITTFNSMMERLEASFQQVRQFSIDASHELRTPITVIRGQLEVALLTGNTKEDYREAILSALQDVERLGQIVKSLLLLAQAESGQLPVQLAQHDLSELISDSVARYQMVAQERDIFVGAQTPDTCEAMVDRTQFERLLSNLLSNAVTYTQEGGRVDVKLTSLADEVTLEVCDNGPGIAAQHLPHIFERFYRIREGDRAEEKGIGLGLAFVAWIVKVHGGRIDVASQPGQGSTFRVVLPRGTTRTLPSQPTASAEHSGELHRATSHTERG